MSKSLVVRALYVIRDLRSRAVFDALRRHASGSVLDVGGWDFVLSAIGKKIPFDRWTVLEIDRARIVPADDTRVATVHGDGCAMTFADESFDTVVSMQVLEHVFEPLRMLHEMSRVLKRSGHAILLIPQTSTTHLAPHFYGNFSVFWIERALSESGFEILEHRRLGGIWSTAASHALYFFLQAFRVPGMSEARIRRSALFYLLFPLQAIWALLTIPVCLFLSLGDLAEEPNNHLVVARRR
jgi:SAM-dependent methyltransferase